MRLIFDFDWEKCSACGACAIACMDQNDVEIETMEPYRKVWVAENGTDRLYLSMACIHCPDAPCIKACRFRCIFKDADSGLTRYDTTKCVGCKACSRACPYNAIVFRPTGEKRPRARMEKCHGCLERIQAGLQPACVQACPTRALGWHWSENMEEVFSASELYQKQKPIH